MLRTVPPMRKAKKEAKRQRSEPTTPISTSSRLPYEYDAVMGITQVDPRETEGFDEGLDLEHHDASEDPNVLEPVSVKQEPGLSHGGCGSSSLRECIELLANTERNAPATLHSGANKDSTSGPPQVMSPNVEESQTTAQTITSGSVPSDSPPLKEESKIHTQPMKSEALTPKEEPSTMSVKDESDESDTIDQGHDALQEEAQNGTDTQPRDSEDSLSQEQVATELVRLAEMRVRAADDLNQDSEAGANVPDVGETPIPMLVQNGQGVVTPEPEQNRDNDDSATPMSTQNRRGANAPDSEWNWEDNESYAPQRSGRLRGRLRLRIHTCLVPPFG